MRFGCLANSLLAPKSCISLFIEIKRPTNLSPFNVAYILPLWLVHYFVFSTRTFVFPVFAEMCVFGMF